MKSSRRQLMKWALGASQLALLDRYNLLRPGVARAASNDRPSRLCVIYYPGGFRGHYCFWPNSKQDVDTQMYTPAHDSNGEPVFFDKNSLYDLGAPNGNYNPLRVFAGWNPANLGQRDSNHTPAMYSFVHHQLASQMVALNGIYQGTADHGSGFISAMSGAPAPDFRAPCLHSVIANWMYDKAGSGRPLPYVYVSSERGLPLSHTLPSRAGPIRGGSIENFVDQLSDHPSNNPWWTGLDKRTSGPDEDFSGKALSTTLAATVLERFALKQARQAAGRSTAAVDTYLESMHDSLRSVSRTLAADVISVLQKTAGVEALKAAPRPDYLKSYGTSGYFNYALGQPGQFQTGAEIEARFDMTLRLLKSGLVTSVHMALDHDYDSHSATGHHHSYAHGRAQMDAIGRFLAELKATPMANGKTLLDDTLVVVLSEFGREWVMRNPATGSAWGGDGHHPYTSLLLAGGNLEGNRSIGSFAPQGVGTELAIRETGNTVVNRVPRSADALATIYTVMGLELNDRDFFIPGGFGEILGARKA